MVVKYSSIQICKACENIIKLKRRVGIFEQDQDPYEQNKTHEVLKCDKQLEVK